jgi:UDP-4-amino-4,6-dideoxy-N-acetyl-beta-L-altrosamine transaminase
MLKQSKIHDNSIRNSFLHPFRHSISEDEINEVIDTLRSDWITTGPKTFKFEDLFKEYVGSNYAIGVNSCTAALQLALAAIDIDTGDEVITTPLTFAATTEVILHQNAEPVLVDIEKDSYNIDPNKIEEKITEKTKAIIPVHYAGNPCKMDEIMDIADDHDLYVIEDAAHAIGSEYKNTKIGCISDITCFSFYATKNITTGEGGMITTNDETLEEKMRILSLHGISKDAWNRYSATGSWYYEILYPGFKCNMDDIQASIGIHQLKKIDEMQIRRFEIAEMYNDAFNSLEQIIVPPIEKNSIHAWHLYPIQIRTEHLKINRNEFIEALKAENIGTSVHFIPIHMHPYYKKKFGFKKGDFPNTESFFEKEISIPLYPRMTDEDVEDVISAINKIINSYKV